MGAAALARPPASLRRILVVEDDPDTQIIVSFALKRGGFAIEVCGTGAEALEKARAFRPDLVLLDVMLPFMDGPSILRRMRADEALAAIPVVFMTARALPEEIAAYRAMDPLDVIVKPFDPMTLAETLSALWTRRRRDASAQETAELRRLEAAYVATLGERVEELARVARRVGSVRGDDSREQLYQLAHRLTGSSAILGFAGVSDAARAIENVALGLHRRRRPPTERERKALSSAVRVLRRVCAEVSSSSPSFPQPV